MMQAAAAILQTDEEIQSQIFREEDDSDVIADYGEKKAEATQDKDKRRRQIGKAKPRWWEEEEKERSAEIARTKGEKHKKEIEEQEVEREQMEVDRKRKRRDDIAARNRITKKTRVEDTMGSKLHKTLKELRGPTTGVAEDSE